MVWTLIIMLTGSQGTTGAIDHLAFPDKFACEQARDAVLKEWVNSAVQIRAVCVATGTKRGVPADAEGTPK
jgi:hypothetical protein